MKTIAKYKTPFGLIRVLRDANGGLAYYQNGSYHSQTDRRGNSRVAYTHVIAEIIRQSHLRRVLIIGCAGGSLASLLRHHGSQATVVDINALAFSIARHYFRMPQNVRCVRSDGIAYLQNTSMRYDAVVVDVFGSNNVVPLPFTTKTFFHAVRRVLIPNGIMIMNTVIEDDNDHRADKVACHAAKAGFNIRLFDWPGHTDRNTLIVGDGKRSLHIPSGREAHFIKPDLEGLIQRTHKRLRARH